MLFENSQWRQPMRRTASHLFLASQLVIKVAVGFDSVRDIYERSSGLDWVLVSVLTGNQCPARCPPPRGVGWEPSCISGLRSADSREELRTLLIIGWSLSGAFFHGIALQSITGDRSSVMGQNPEFVMLDPGRCSRPKDRIIVTQQLELPLRRLNCAKYTCRLELPVARWVSWATGWTCRSPLTRVQVHEIGFLLCFTLFMLLPPLTDPPRHQRPQRQIRNSGQPTVVDHGSVWSYLIMILD